MAQLEVMGPYEGPGEKKTAERLEAELPASWVIFAGRKLPGENRDDVDLIVVGQYRVFVLEEKAWGPRVVADDNMWMVGDKWRPNPLNRNAQLARKVAGLMRDRVTGYKALGGRHVLGGVVMSHDNLVLHRGAHHDPTERILPLAEASAALIALDSAGADGIKGVRNGVLGFLRGMPAAGTRPKTLGDYRVLGRVEVPGLEVAYGAESADGQAVVLKCYRTSQLEEYGDPREFLERETRAINKLADLGRTWRALPFFSSEEWGLFVVPLIPPNEGRDLEASERKPDPGRTDGRLDEAVARKVLCDAFEALAEVHEYGLVHRALHPRRIWLGRGLRVLFSDFHLARMSGATSVSLWAPDHDISEDYRAPECANNVGLAATASDVFSLSLCLSGWLLGQNPTELTRAELQEALREMFPWAEPLADACAPRSADRPSAAEMAGRFAPPPPAPELAFPPDPIEIELGNVIHGRYLIDKELGHGGFAHTWVVYDQQTDQRKVLKTFHRDLPQEAVNEYRSAEKLRHDRCARVYDMQTVEPPQYLVLEYVEGMSLAELAPVPGVEGFRAIASDVITALEYIHSKELVHGDVTPTNIIVDATDRATLIDFGLSVARGDQPMGWNPRFSAPEVQAGMSATPLGDLYGIAASIIYSMLGRAAKRDAGPQQLALEPPTEAERLQWGEDGAALLSALFRAVDPDPSRRPQTATELLELVRSARPVDIPDTTDEFVVNPNVEAIRRLYRASDAGNAGNRGLDDAFAKSTYVPTMLDQELEPRVLAGELSIVLLTGNPGDGKTSFLVSLGDELVRRGATQVHVDEAGWQLSLDGRDFRAVFDASESHGSLTSDALVMAALQPVIDSPDSAVALIAVNDGRLLQFFTDHAHEFEELALDVTQQIAGASPKNARIAVVDLKRRSLAAVDGTPGLAAQALAKLTDAELWRKCDGCRAKTVCPILANQRLLAGEGAEAFGELVLTSHLRRRRRATFRDVRSAAAWLLTGDRSCEEVHDLVRGAQDPRYLDAALAFDLAFASDSNDYLVDEWSAIDPGAVAAPMVDALRRTNGSVGQVAAGRYRSVRSVARALYFGDWSSSAASKHDLRAYRYLDEFSRMLTGSDRQGTRRRLLLGISRLAGAFGFHDPGLAMSSGMPDSDWAVLHLVHEDKFEVHLDEKPASFVEAIPDKLTLQHASGPEISLTLDTAEVILRAADGEIVDDLGSDSIRQEIDGFVSQLSREPSDSARVVDTSGSVAVASRDGIKIRLERS